MHHQPNEGGAAPKYVWNAGPRPDKIMVYFCSVCGFAFGIQDYDRIQHEHFDTSEQCSGGRFDIVTYEREAAGDV